MVVVLQLWRSECSLLEGGVMVLSCRWGSESKAFAFQIRTSTIHVCVGSIRRGVENSAIDDGLFHVTHRNTVWDAYSLIST